MIIEIKTTIIPEVEAFIDDGNTNTNNPTFGELNLPITGDEVRAAVRNLNRNKSASPSDNLLNEYFIETIDILVGHITDLFNIVFNAGYFPELWTQGFIVPLHKKGDNRNVNNYRGITLISNFGKLFTSILTSRVEKWFDDNNMLSDAQFGFRKGLSTVYAIFVLHNLVQHMLSENKRFPCAFVDLKKAFDSVY